MDPTIDAAGDPGSRLFAPDFAGSAAAGPLPWQDPSGYWSALSEATAGLPAPVAALSLAALRYNAADLLRRADGVPVRVASKSLRVRGVIEQLQKCPGFRGVFAYTLAEALWLADTCTDVLVGYPSTDRASLARLAADGQLAARVTLMVDDESQLDLLDAVRAPGQRTEVRVCVDADASWQAPVLGFIGTRRSPLHRPDDVVRLGARIVARPGFRLVGLMMYEAQVAGVGDAVPGAGPVNTVMRRIQHRSMAELRGRRRAAAVRLGALADLEFVNGGGTGSVHSTRRDPAVTEITAGSGLFAGHAFDNYRAFTPAPAAGYGFDVVRRPAPDTATVLGAGWIASGPPGPSRAPRPVWPQGLQLLAREGAGEVQTPLRGSSAAQLRPGDRVWFRHAKSGEPAEHVNEYHLVDGGRVVAELPTYRGEGKAFL